MDDLFDSRDSGAIDLARRLEAFAEARLTPSVASTKVLRGAVMAAAHRRAALLAAEGAGQAAAASPTVVTDVPVRRGHRAWRRPLVALLAGGLTLGVLAGTAFAAQPGGLLYDGRIWAEMATLPAGGVDRAEAEVHRLEDRLAEAISASAAGDRPALEAALAAYAAIVAEAAVGGVGDPAANALIEAAVMRHVAILTALAVKAPLPARAAIQNALDSSTKVLDDIDRATPGGNGGSGGTGGNGTGGNGANGGGGGTGTPGGPSPATPTAKPPKPTPLGNDKAPKPQATDHRPPNGPGGQANPPASSARP